MRQIIYPQLKFGGQDISRIVLDLRSRDDIPRPLRALQYIDVTPRGARAGIRDPRLGAPAQEAVGRAP